MLSETQCSRTRDQRLFCCYVDSALTFVLLLVIPFKTICMATYVSYVLMFSLTHVRSSISYRLTGDRVLITVFIKKII